MWILQKRKKKKEAHTKSIPATPGTHKLLFRSTYFMHALVVNKFRILRLYFVFGFVEHPTNSEKKGRGEGLPAPSLWSQIADRLRVATNNHLQQICSRKRNCTGICFPSERVAIYALSRSQTESSLREELYFFAWRCVVVGRSASVHRVEKAISVTVAR